MTIVLFYTDWTHWYMYFYWICSCVWEYRQYISNVRILMTENAERGKDFIVWVQMIHDLFVYMYHIWALGSTVSRIIVHTISSETINFQRFLGYSVSYFYSVLMRTIVKAKQGGGEIVGVCFCYFCWFDYSHFTIPTDYWFILNKSSANWKLVINFILFSILI